MMPSISIIIVNRNSGKKLQKCLASIKKQKYPRKLVEILIIDGGSTDNSSSLAKSYSAKFIYGGFPSNMEARRHVGTVKSKNEILAFIDADNYLPTTQWLQRMVEPFKEKDIFASQTTKYAYRKTDSLLSRYFSLFGFNDPVAYYLGKADRLPHFQNQFNFSSNIIDRKKYYKVTFPSSEKLPTVGCNGFLIRKSVLKKVLTSPENFFHIDVIADLVNKGYSNIAFVKNDIIHDTGENIKHLLSKRISYFNNHSVLLNKNRRYKVYNSKNPNDNIKLFLFIFYSVTFAEPLFQSIRGYIKIRDVAWFAHPFVCLIFTTSYATAIIRNAIIRIL